MNLKLEIATPTFRAEGTQAPEKCPACVMPQGYFALLNNELKDPVQALEIYRNNDLVEKAFDNLKERLNLHRLAVSSEQHLDGKRFVLFVALVCLSNSTKKMQKTSPFKEFILQEVLEEFDVTPSASFRIRQTVHGHTWSPMVVIGSARQGGSSRPV